MIDKIPQKFQDLLQDEKQAYAVLATLNKDGTPQVTPIWFNTDGTHILINTAKGRMKAANMTARRDVALDILDPQNPYRYIQIQGKVVDITTDGAEKHIHALAHKYTGQDYKLNPSETRLLFKILPEKVSTWG